MPPGGFRSMQPLRQSGRSCDSDGPPFYSAACFTLAYDLGAENVECAGRHGLANVQKHQRLPGRKSSLQVDQLGRQRH